MASEDAGKKEEETTVNILGTDYEALADGSYDALILGTGLKECMIAGMLSVFEGKKVCCARAGATFVAAGVTSFFAVLCVGAPTRQKRLLRQ